MAGLPSTVYPMVIRRNRDAAGMERIVGDVGLFFKLVDIAVHPAHQGRGLARPSSPLWSIA